MSQDSQTRGNTKVIQQKPEPVPVSSNLLDESEDEEEYGYDEEEAEEERVYQSGNKQLGRPSLSQQGQQIKQELERNSRGNPNIPQNELPEYAEFLRYKQMKEEEELQQKYNEIAMRQAQVNAQLQAQQQVQMPQVQQMQPVQPVNQYPQQMQPVHPVNQLPQQEPVLAQIQNTIKQNQAGQVQPNVVQKDELDNLLIQMERLNNNGLYRFETLTQFNRLNVNLEILIKLLKGERV